MYEVGTGRGVHAFHVMPGMEGPEGVLHAHDYRLEAVVERSEVDARGMVCDLDVLEAALAVAAGQVDGQDLERIRPADVPAVTVEVFARWLHATLAEPVRRDGGEFLAVRVWESPVAFAGYRAPLR